jgi:transposase
MPAQDTITNSLLLPELKILAHAFKNRSMSFYLCEKSSEAEVCPKCATLSRSVYDRREVTIKDAPVRDKAIFLRIRKRRFFCKPCQKPFTEPVSGITKGQRTTQRLKRSVLWACENFIDLERVRRAFHVSSGFIFKTYYEQLERRRRTRLYPWPRTIGIDEHSFRRNKRLGITEFATVIVDYPNRRVMEVVDGKTGAALSDQLAHIEGRGNVRNVVVDLCDPFKSFAREYFPNAKLVADKFHVLRLLHPAINRRRKEITGDQRTNPIRKLLLRSAYRLDYFERDAISRWLESYPELREIYLAKEWLHRFYRLTSRRQAERILTRITDTLAHSRVPELKTLRRTLMKWRAEILAYFETRLTNGRTEGFNNLAKLVQKRAFGYKSFRNYRLRLLNSCA